MLKNVVPTTTDNLPMIIVTPSARPFGASVGGYMMNMLLELGTGVLEFVPKKLELAKTYDKRFVLG